MVLIGTAVLTGWYVNYDLMRGAAFLGIVNVFWVGLALSFLGVWILLSGVVETLTSKGVSMPGRVLGTFVIVGAFLILASCWGVLAVDTFSLPYNRDGRTIFIVVTLLIIAAVIKYHPSRKNGQEQ